MAEVPLLSSLKLHVLDLPTAVMFFTQSRGDLINKLLLDMGLFLNVHNPTGTVKNTTQLYQRYTTIETHAYWSLTSVEKAMVAELFKAVVAYWVKASKAV